MGEAIPLPSRIITVAAAYLEVASLESGMAPMWRKAQLTAGAFDPGVLILLHAELSGAPMPPDVHGGRVDVAVADLQEGMVLAEPIYTTSGSILLHEGETLTEKDVARVLSFRLNGVLETKTVAISGPVVVD
jgi:hypothetical protein